MAAAKFVDYYELLEISSNANLESIERVFRFLATKWHPDAGETGDRDKFSLLVKAYETLKDPKLRAAYDEKHKEHQELTNSLVENAEAAGEDCVDRQSLLALFYAKRRQDIASPGLGVASVEHMLKCDGEVLRFHIWYFREKGWIQREEDGGFSITAAGVDRVEENETKASAASADRMLGFKNDKKEMATAGA